VALKEIRQLACQLVRYIYISLFTSLKILYIQLPLLSIRCFRGLVWFTGRLIYKRRAILGFYSVTPFIHNLNFLYKSPFFYKDQQGRSDWVIYQHSCKPLSIFPYMPDTETVLQKSLLYALRRFTSSKWINTYQAGLVIHLGYIVPFTSPIRACICSSSVLWHLKSISQDWFAQLIRHSPFHSSFFWKNSPREKHHLDR